MMYNSTSKTCFCVFMFTDFRWKCNVNFNVDFFIAIFLFSLRHLPLGPSSTLNSRRYSSFLATMLLIWCFTNTNFQGWLS